MYIKRHWYWLCLFLFIVICNSAIAQDTLYIKTALNPSSGNSVNVCGSIDTFLVTIVNKSSDTLTNLVLDPKMPIGVAFEDTVDNLTIISSTPSNEPDLGLTADTLFPGDSIIVQYSFSVNCEVIGFINDGNAPVNNSRIDFKINGTSYYNLEKNPNSYNILYPDLVIMRITPNKLTGNIGDTLPKRKITVVNGGYGPAYGFSIVDKHDPGISTLYLLMGSDTILPTSYSMGDTVYVEIVKVQLFSTE